MLPVELSQSLTVYLMFAVECDGRGQYFAGEGKDAIPYDVSEAVLEYSFDGAPTVFPNCLLCSPPPPDRNNCRTVTTPVTRYVFFICDNLDFQSDVRGPFDVFPAPPSQAQGQWIGVPQAFMDAEQRVMYFYVHPQAEASYAGSGLSAVPMSGVRAAVRSLRNDPRAVVSGSTGLVHNDTDRDALSALFNRQVVSLGDIHVRGLEGGSEVTVSERVDEHFVFCGEVLHLFMTRRQPSFSVGEQGGAQTGEVLDAAVHARAFERYDAARIEAELASPGAEPDARSMVLAFQCTASPLLEIAALTGDPTSNLNDPTAYRLDETDPDSAWMLLVFCEDLRGLLIGSCCALECASDAIEGVGEPGTDTAGPSGLSHEIVFTGDLGSAQPPGGLTFVDEALFERVGFDHSRFQYALPSPYWRRRRR